MKRFCEMFTLKYDYLRQVLKDPRRNLTKDVENDLLEAIDKFIKDKEDKRKSFNTIDNA